MTFTTITERFGRLCPKGSRWLLKTTEVIFEETDDTLVPLEKEMVNVYHCLYEGYPICTLTEETLLNHPQWFKQTR